MLTPWTSTTEPILPTRRARAGWKRMASVVPRLVSAKTALREARPSPNFPWTNTLRNGITWPAPSEIRKPGRTRRTNVARSEIRGMSIRIVPRRRVRSGRAASGSPTQGLPGRPSSVRQSRRRARGPVIAHCPQDGRGGQGGHQHQDQQDVVGPRITGREAAQVGDHGRDGAPRQRRYHVDPGGDRALEREQLAPVLGAAVLGHERRLDHGEGLVGSADERSAGDHGERRPDDEQTDDPDRGHARRQDEHEPAPDPVREQACRERCERRGRRRCRAHDPDERGVEAERGEIEVEVDPPEAEHDAVDQRRQEEDAGVSLEAGEAPRVAAERAGHAPGPGVAGARTMRGAIGRVMGGSPEGDGARCAVHPSRREIGPAGDVSAVDG